jgi:hypothetical protein
LHPITPGNKRTVKELNTEALDNPKFRLLDVDNIPMEKNNTLGSNFPVHREYMIDAWIKRRNRGFLRTNRGFSLPLNTSSKWGSTWFTTSKADIPDHHLDLLIRTGYVKKQPVDVFNILSIDQVKMVEKLLLSKIREPEEKRYYPYKLKKNTDNIMQRIPGIVKDLCIDDKIRALKRRFDWGKGSYVLVPRCFLNILSSKMKGNALELDVNLYHVLNDVLKSRKKVDFPAGKVKKLRVKNYPDADNEQFSFSESQFPAVKELVLETGRHFIDSHNFKVGEIASKKSLKMIEINNDKKFLERDKTSFDIPSLEELKIGKLDSLDSVPGLHHSRQLKEINVGEMQRYYGETNDDYTVIEEFPLLEEFSYPIKTFNPSMFEKNKHLSYLDINNDMKQSMDIDDVKGLESLKKLRFDMNDDEYEERHSYVFLDGLLKLPSLKEVSFKSSPHFLQSDDDYDHVNYRDYCAWMKKTGIHKSKISHDACMKTIVNRLRGKGFDPGIKDKDSGDELILKAGKSYLGYVENIVTKLREKGIKVDYSASELEELIEYKEQGV